MAMNTNPFEINSLKVFKTNGQQSIEQIHLHELKMDSLLKKWKKNEHNINTSFRLPGVYPSVYLKAVPRSCDSINTNYSKNREEKKRDEPEKTEPVNKISTGKTPVIRAVSLSNEDYTNYINIDKMNSDMHKSIETPRNYSRKVKKLGLSESGHRKINATLEANILKYKVPTAIKFEREVSIIKRKMKMNQISQRKLNEMRVTIEELSKESAPKNSQVEM